MQVRDESQTANDEQPPAPMPPLPLDELLRQSEEEMFGAVPGLHAY